MGRQMSLITKSTPENNRQDCMSVNFMVQLCGFITLELVCSAVIKLVATFLFNKRPQSRLRYVLFFVCMLFYVFLLLFIFMFAANADDFSGIRIACVIVGFLLLRYAVKPLFRL